MNIALFTETYYPEINGVATSVLMLKKKLEEKGHNVYVFTTTSPGSPEYEYNVFRVPSMPCFLITERRVGLFYQPKLASIIKKLDLDIIHTHTEFSLGVFGRIMARELKVPIIHTYHTIYEDYTHYVTHGNILDKRAKSFVRVFSKICCNSVQRVIVPTEKVKELLMHYNVHKRISVIPTGIDLKKFRRETYQKEQIEEIKKKYGLTPENKVVLYLGRIAQEKNIREILKAMPLYLKKHSEVKMVLVGGGPDKEKLVNQVEKLGLSERILFTGEQPWDDIGMFYQIGDVFVSASNSETQGLTYIEAMAAGLPVVAKQDSCLKGILQDGQNGYTFTTQQELVNGLDKVLYNPEVPYGENSLEKVKRYSAEGYADAVEAVYESVLGEQDHLYHQDTMSI